MRYKVIESTSVYGLSELIEAYFKSGWVLQGGVSAFRDGWVTYYQQALVKE